MVVRVATCKGSIQLGLSRSFKLLRIATHTTPSSRLQRTTPKLLTSVKFHAQIQDQVLPTSMSSTITADQWDQRKEEILRLYIDEGWTLKPIKRKFESPDFHPT